MVSQIRQSLFRQTCFCSEFVKVVTRQCFPPYSNQWHVTGLAKMDQVYLIINGKYLGFYIVHLCSVTYVNVTIKFQYHSFK